MSLVGLTACMQSPSSNSFAAAGDNGSGFYRHRAKIADATPMIASPGQKLDYGNLAKACDVPARAMGTEIARFPETRAKYRLYDTKPGASTPRTFYITGFADRCARQFTGSLAMFGDLEMYETLRYGAAGKTLPISATDRAYEQLKTRVCRVPNNSPCGDKIGKLERNTTFLSVYERFGGNKKWMDILLHKGAVVAVDRKG